MGSLRASLACLALVASLAACKRAHEPPPSQEPPPSHEPPPAPKPAPGVAPRPDAATPLATPVLALDAPGPTPPEAGGAHFGVRWRVTLSGAAPVEGHPSAESLVLGDEVFLGRAGAEIEVRDRATGAVRRRARLPHSGLGAAGGLLVVTTDAEEIALDKDRLVPVWRRPRGNMVLALGDWILETPSSGPRGIRLRRAADAELAWELDERIDSPVGARHALAGDTLYLQLEGPEVAAIEVATGKIRWRVPGWLFGASGRHVAVAYPPYLRSPNLRSVEILDTDGRARWLAEGVSNLLLHGDVAYATTPAALVAIDLVTGAVKWRRAQAVAYAVSDAWLFGWTDAGLATILARDTGAVAGQMHLGWIDPPPRLSDQPVLLLADRWLLGLGAIAAPEPTAVREARGCLVVTGCYGNTARVTGATVTIAGATATTDRRGCFSVRARLGSGPVPIAITGGKMGPYDLQLDSSFPEAVVFDRGVVTLGASWLGGGCHDSRPGRFP